MPNVTVMAPGWQLKLRREVRPVVRNVAIAIAGDVRSNLRAGGHVVTGALLRSVRVRALVNGYGVYIATDHWHYIEFGTRPHRILPVNRQALASKGVLFGPVATVNHPGNRAYRPVQRAFYQKRHLGAM